MKKQLNNQEVFNKVARALIKQGEASVPAGYNDITDTCRYRIRKGTRTLKCAVGHLLPAKLYDKRMEGVTADVVVFGGTYEDKHFADISEACGLSDVSSALLFDLQDAHDVALADDGMERWKSWMRVVARRYRLNYDVLEGER